MNERVLLVLVHIRLIMRNVKTNQSVLKHPGHEGISNAELHSGSFTFIYCIC